MVVVGILLFVPYWTTMVVSTEDGQLYILGKDWCRFSHQFTHSVSLSEVEEVYYVRNGRVMLSSVYYSDQGAGLPESGTGEFVVGERFGMEGMERYIGTLKLQINGRYHNRISNDEEAILLYDYFDGQRVMIEVKTLSLFTWIFAGDLQ